MGFSPKQVELAGGQDGVDAHLHRRGVDRVGLFAQQPEDYGLVGAVSLARCAEGAKQLRAHCGHFGQQPHSAQAQRIHARRLHRTHCVRTGRADPDLEEVKDAN